MPFVLFFCFLFLWLGRFYSAVCVSFVNVSAHFASQGLFAEYRQVSQLVQRSPECSRSARREKNSRCIFMIDPCFTCFFCLVCSPVVLLWLADDGSKWFCSCCVSFFQITTCKSV